jgi:alpha-glucosidase (family GH31 glycosyl hydrolase)
LRWKLFENLLVHCGRLCTWRYAATGPAFEGGLDCYSHPPDCVQQYYQVWGQGLVSRNGFVIVNDTNATRLAPAPPPGSSSLQWFDPASTRVSNHIDKEDLYLLVSGLEYTRALGEWASVGGAPSLPPLSALGNWYSRYYPYGEETYEGTIIENYSHYGIPLSVGVLDVPWHNINYAVSDLGPDKQGTAPPGRGCNGWDGFTFNRTLFPDPKRFFDKVHSEGIKMILSVHMQNGIDHCQEQYPAMAKAMGYSDARIAANWTINCTMDNISYVENFFKHIVNSAPIKGTADYWWLDYPGGASEISGWTQQEAASLQWSNRMFAEHKRGMGERPVILARYGGLGQQRDGLGFSGDTFESYGTLEFQAVMTPTSSNALFGW